MGLRIFTIFNKHLRVNMKNINFLFTIFPTPSTYNYKLGVKAKAIKYMDLVGLHPTTTNNSTMLYRGKRPSVRGNYQIFWWLR